MHRMDILVRETVTRLWDEHSPALVLYARQWCDMPRMSCKRRFLLLVRQGVAPEIPGMAVSRGQEPGDQCGTGGGRRRSSARPQRPPAASHGLKRPTGTAGHCRGDRGPEQLPADQREAIVARLWGGLSFEEISLLSGSSVSTVYRCYQRGLVPCEKG